MFNNQLLRMDENACFVAFANFHMLVLLPGWFQATNVILLNT